MNSLKRLISVMLPVVLLLSLWSCREQEAPVPTSTGELRATARYLEYFGEPPQVSEGTCFALVGFYPSARVAGKVSPFPLFLINPERQLETVTEQLLRWGEGWDLGGVLLDPFPPGTELISLGREGDMVRVELSASAWHETDDAQKRAILDVLGHTLTQFEEVERVMVVAGGRLFPYQGERAFFPDPQALVPPGPPQVLAARATWEAGSGRPTELTIFFDRPVTVRNFRLSDERGRALEGEYYRTLFDMALVLHPDHSETITEGMIVQVQWKASDGRGRVGKGQKSLRVVRFAAPEHQSGGS